MFQNAELLALGGLVVSVIAAGIVLSRVGAASEETMREKAEQQESVVAAPVKPVRPPKRRR